MVNKQFWHRTAGSLTTGRCQIEESVADGNADQSRYPDGEQSTLQGLLNGIICEAAEETRWLVLADWLEENDDPRRGELLRLHRNMLATCLEPGKHAQRASWRARLVELIGRGILPCVPQKKLILPGRVSMTFSLIPAGSFWMGSDHKDSQARMKPAHPVTLTQGFFIGIYPVTQEQWAAVMALPVGEPGALSNSGWDQGRQRQTDPYLLRGRLRGEVVGTDFSHFKGATLPMEQVAVRDAEEFCKRLTKSLNGTGTAQLPTEAQWEFACRAGTTTHYQKYQTGDTEVALKKAGWYQANSGFATHAVGSMCPNAWGLYDMHGNVWEWCRDAGRGYTAGCAVDPLGTERDGGRICRGGAWNSPAEACVTAARDTRNADDISSDLGFRVVLVLPG